MPDSVLPAPESTSPERTRAVRPKHAASLLVVRQAPGGTETLMGMRGAKHRFMPNRLVFPGGKVDRADYRAKLGAPLRPDVHLRLEKASSPTLCRALAHAVARELEEETGLSLGRPPALDGLDYLCRAVTPPASPIRFDARFLVVDESRVSGTLAGSGELEGLRFYPVEEALALDLAYATRVVLEQLKIYLALSEEERRGRTRTPFLYRRAWRME